MKKICKDGRIWGQNNKEAGSHLGIFLDRKAKKGFNLNSKGSPFKRGLIPWNKGTKGVMQTWNKGLGKGRKYSLEFLSSLRELIRERDGYMCQLCGCLQEDCSERLSIHHIDYNKKNDSLNNLIALCRSCHSKTQVNRLEWKERFNHGRCNNDQHQIRLAC